MISKIGYFKIMRARYGTKQTLLWAVLTIARRIFRYRGYVSLEYGKSSINTDIYYDFLFREVTYNELVNWSKDSTYDLPIDFVDKLDQSTTRCFGVFDPSTGALASYIFSTTARTIVETGYYFEFPLGDAYFYKGFTLPRYRGHRLYEYCLTQAAGAIESNSTINRRILTLIDLTNLASLKSMQRAGFKKTVTFHIFMNFAPRCVGRCRDYKIYKD